MPYKRFANIVFGFKILFITLEASAINTTLSIQGETQPVKPGKRHERSLENDRPCSGKNMEFDSPNGFSCKYDDLCYQIFKDCCSDFVKKCGNQTSIMDEGIKRHWQCIELSQFNTLPFSSLWMVGSCPSDWLFDEIRQKCEKPLNDFRSIDGTLPVVSKVKRFTYQNKFCAICNRDESFVPFQIKATTSVIPPENYNLAEKLMFLRRSYGKVWLKIPSNQPRRYCFGESYIETCDKSSHPLNRSCVEGFIQIVRRRALVYKNRNCLQCNKDRGGGGAPPGSTDFKSFSLIFTMDDSVTHTRYIQEHVKCNGGWHDENLKICKEAIITKAKDNFSNKFLVLITFLVSKQLGYEISSGLIGESFQLDSQQISSLQRYFQGAADDDSSSANIYIVASFRLTLTPFQELMLENQNKVHASIESKKFLKFFNFSESFTISWKNNSFTIVKVATKRLACYRGKKLQNNEYRLNDHERILYEIKTGRNYSLNDYSILNDRTHIVLCSKLVLSDCLNGTYVKLFTNEFVILPDLSLYHNTSNMTYQFGDYQITESLNESSQYSFTFPVDEIHMNGTSKPKVSISVCLPSQSNDIRTILTHRSSFVLGIVEILGFSVSSMFLLGLLITYGLFPELRTLPGLNLMSLALSMLLSHLIWLTGARLFHDTTFCVILAVLNHYLLLVTFHAMSIVSYHCSYVFSQSFVLPRSDKRLKTFAKYSLFVWLHPALFVTICFVLDKLSIFTINYGVLCWLGSKSGKLYFFLLPVALLVVFNVVSFSRTAVNLARKGNQTKILKKQGKQNLKACIKLATLVSFPHVFGFLRLIFPTVEAFVYLFVVCVSLQGFYIGLAFICTEKTFALYRKRFTANPT